MKTTQYPEKSIAQQIQEMNDTRDAIHKKDVRNLYCAVYLGIIIGIALSWVGLCCYFYFGHH